MRAALYATAKCGRSCRFRVKTGKAQCEQMFSAVHPTTDIAKILRHVRFVPKSGSETARNHLYQCWMKSRITAMARSGASGIAGNKETVRTERAADAVPPRCRGELVSPYS